MFKSFIKRASQITLVGVAVTAGVANAAIDTSSVTTALTDAGAAIAVVGAAYLAMRVGGRVFKWIQGAL